MMSPIVIAHHLIWTAYGHWLPNDPRGSGSHQIQNDVLAELGEVHLGRKKIQPAGKAVRQFRDVSADLLKHARLSFDQPALTCIANSFAETITANRYTCYACALMPDHVHILIRKHKDDAEDMIEKLTCASRDALIAAGLRSPTHPVWTKGGDWKVFLEHPDEVRRTIRYIERNPLEISLPPQVWPFVTPDDGWPLHPGHSPNSPYAKRLRAVGRYP
jgi:REP element-mobilizing transposase RayT